MRALPFLALLLFTASTDVADAAPPDKVMNEDAACTHLKRYIAKANAIPEAGPPGMDWFCEFAPYEDKRWLLVALRSNRKCDGICSNLMGWYAVERSTGSIHDWNMGEYEVGAALPGQ